MSDIRECPRIMQPDSETKKAAESAPAANGNEVRLVCQPRIQSEPNHCNSIDASNVSCQLVPTTIRLEPDVFT